MKRRTAVTALLALLVLTGAATAIAQPGGGTQVSGAALVTDPAGLINLPPGYSYTSLVTGCTPARSTESSATVPYPEDPDGNALFKAPTGGDLWLLSNAELTQPRQGDFQGDVGKCHVDEQTPGDDDSDGWGSVQRITLENDGTTVKALEVLTTGLHNLCAVAVTPWKTLLTNEEFPFINDPDLRSGWAWEVDPETGAAKRLTGMGRFSHEQQAYASPGDWYQTDDRGDARFIYRFDPHRNRDLTAGDLYGLAFNRATLTGTWIGPLNPLDPDADMRARGFNPAVWGFFKAEGIVAQGSSDTRGGNYFVFSESGQGADPGRIWRIDHLGNDETVHGRVLVEGDWARLGRPDNIRFNDAGDLFIMEDHSASDFRRGATENVNQVWVLPRGEEGAENLVLLAASPDEPTGPWFSFDNEILYLSVQAEPPRVSHIIAVRHPKNWNQPFDR